MARSSAATGWTALVALSLGSGCGSSDATGGATGQPGGGGDGSGGKATSVVSSSSSSAAIASATGVGGGGDGFVCDPPAAAGSIYELTGNSFAFVQPVSMCKYRGDVMLVVNTAAL